MIRTPLASCLTPSRLTHLSGQITYLTGAELSFSGDQAISFTLSEGAADGRLLGGAFSASCALTLDNHDAAFTHHRSLWGAYIRVYLHVGEDRMPLAAFTVSKAAQQENDSRLTLSGSDALGGAFEGAFEDDLAYPQTLGSLAQAIAARAGFSLTADFPNASFSIPDRPRWGDISLRQALAHVSCAAGCFALIGRDGALRLRPVWQGDTVYALPAEATLRREYGDQTFGPLTGLAVSCTGAPKDAQPLTVTADQAPLAESSSLSVSENPLFPYEGAHTQALAEALLSTLRGMTAVKARLTWRGDPSLSLGDRVRITDSQGDDTAAVVTAQTLAFFQGFSMQTDCLLPTRQAAAGRIFTAGGALNAAKLQGSVDGVLIRDGTIAARALVAGSVTAAQLAAGAVTADKIAAGAVTADKISAGSVTADKISAGSVTADKVAAHAVTADKLAAGAVTAGAIAAGAVTAAKIAAGSVTAEKIASHTISAGLLEANLITADSGLIDTGAIGTAQIADGSITDAKIVGLTANKITAGAIDARTVAINNLVADNITTGTLNGRVIPVLGTDKLADGAVTGDKVAQNAVTADKIVAEAVTSAKIAANAVTANKIAANAVTAAKIDVADLFAAQATVNALNAMDITGNTYLQLLVNGKSRNYSQWTDPALDSGNTVRDGDVWEQGIPYVTWQKLGQITWAQAARYPWWAFSGSRLHIRRGGAWVIVTDPKELQEQRYLLSQYRSRVLVTDEKIDMQSRQIEMQAQQIALQARSLSENGVGKVRNASVLIDPDGIDMTGGRIRMQAGTEFKVESGGSFVVNAQDGSNSSIRLGNGNMNVTEAGDLSCVSGQFGSLRVGGSPVMRCAGSVTDFLVVLSAAEPSGHGILWIRPGALQSVGYTCDTNIQYWSLTSTHNLLMKANSGDTLGAGDTFHYRFTLPLREIDHRKTGLTAQVTLSKSGNTVLLGPISFEIRQWQLLTLTFEGDSAVNLFSDAGDITAAVQIANADSGGTLTLNPAQYCTLEGTAHINAQSAQAQPCTMTWIP